MLTRTASSLRMRSTYYVPLSGDLSDSGRLERVDFGQIVDGERSCVVRLPPPSSVTRSRHGSRRGLISDAQRKGRPPCEFFGSSSQRPWRSSRSRRAPQEKPSSASKDGSSG